MLTRGGCPYRDCSVLCAQANEKTASWVWLFTPHEAGTSRPSVTVGKSGLGGGSNLCSLTPSYILLLAVDPASQNEQ